MKLMSAAALALVAIAATPVAVPAIAQNEASETSFTIDTPIETLMANEATKAILVKHLGPLDQHPAYGQFKAMSLVELQPWSGGEITAEALEKIKADLAAL